MTFKNFIITAILISFTACKNETRSNTVDLKTNTIISELIITPIKHATFVLEYGDQTIYIDPTGDKIDYKAFKKADFILITDIHSDHLDLNTLEYLNLNDTKIIAPEAVYSKLPKKLKENTIALVNSITEDFTIFKLETIPMYNLRPEALEYHKKGRGNGYVLTFGNERIYISGDTEDIPEMRNLKNISKAFICMNLPYTMTVKSAANAVLEFKPKQVYPYHYRGTEGFSDVAKFKTLVNEGDQNIEVIQLDWYPKN